MTGLADLIEPSGPRGVQSRSYRYGAVYALLICIVAGLVARSFYLQVVEGGHFRSAAEGNRVATRLVTAPRGIVYDIQGEQLVENVASTDVVLDPVRLPAEENESILIDQLPSVLPDLSGSAIQEALARARRLQRPVRVAAALDHDTVLAIERQLPTLPGVELVSSLVRRYPDGRATAPFLGYTGYVAENDVSAQPYLVGTDIIGKTGIEREYDQQLHGRHGVSYVEINAQGQAQKIVREETAIAGVDLHLSVDMSLQTYITSLLQTADDEARERGEPGVSGAVVALDPRTGGVRALVSYPSYDANIFSQPKLADQAAAVIGDERELLFNRAVSGMYPPGSTIKPFLAAAALEENIVSSDTTFLSTGGIQVGPWNFPDWKAGGHGVTDIKKAIAESVNTFFYLISGGDASHVGLGLKRMNKYLAGFGWGEVTAIDMPNEAAGFLPTEEWKLATKKEPWYIGDTYHLAIGQGDVLVTPLQVAVATAAIANGGFVHQPSIVHAVAQGDEEPEPVKRDRRRVPVSAADLQVVREGMRETVTSGSGRALLTVTVPLAGKTGTAQFGSGTDTHAWFTSYGPYESPELVVTVLLEGGGAGDEKAVPMAQQIWQWWVENKN